MTAMTAASLDVLTGGRFRLGLGVSGPQVSEGWHGVRFDKPLARTREYLAVVNTALGRQTCASTARHYQLPLPDGPGKPLKLTLAPVSPHIRTYLAAVGPKNIELAGELTDGWLAIFFAPELAAEPLAALRPAGPRPAGRWTASTSCPPSPGRRRRSAGVRRPGARVRRPLRRRHGQPGAELLQRPAVRMGFGEAAATVQDLFLSGGSATPRPRCRSTFSTRPHCSVTGTGSPTGCGAGRRRSDDLLRRARRRLGGGEAERHDGRRRGARVVRER
jgi:alkanesulfonate monooxygenase SsuD/methylene tetrahydromethanopterin reductase-like flavin-dependent oxidoreductase (luciferase family)